MKGSNGRSLSSNRWSTKRTTSWISCHPRYKRSMVSWWRRYMRRSQCTTPRCSSPRNWTWVISSRMPTWSVVRPEVHRAMNVAWISSTVYPFPTNRRNRCSMRVCAHYRWMDGCVNVLFVCIFVHSIYNCLFKICLICCVDKFIWLHREFEGVEATEGTGEAKGADSGSVHGSCRATTTRFLSQGHDSIVTEGCTAPITEKEIDYPIVRWWWLWGGGRRVKWLGCEWLAYIYILFLR